MTSHIKPVIGKEISTKWARVAIDPRVIDSTARALISVIVVRPMLDYYLTLHDASSLEECVAENLVYKIDSGWAVGSKIPRPEWDPLAGDANTTGSVFTLNVPLTHGLTCSSVGLNGEFVVVYDVTPVAAPT